MFLKKRNRKFTENENDDELRSAPLERFFRVENIRDVNNEQLISRGDGSLVYTIQLLATNDIFTFDQFINFTNRYNPRKSNLYIDNISITTANPNIGGYFPLKFNLFNNQQIEFGSNCTKDTIVDYELIQTPALKDVENNHYRDFNVWRNEIDFSGSESNVLDYEMTKSSVFFLNGDDRYDTDPNELYIANRADPTIPPNLVAVTGNPIQLFGNGTYVWILTALGTGTGVVKNIICYKDNVRLYDIEIPDQLDELSYYQYGHVINDFLSLGLYVDVDTVLPEDKLRLLLLGPGGIQRDSEFDLVDIQDELGIPSVNYCNVIPIVKNQFEIPKEYIGYARTSNPNIVKKVKFDTVNQLIEDIDRGELNTELFDIFVDTFDSEPSNDFNVYSLDGVNFVSYRRLNGNWIVHRWNSTILPKSTFKALNSTVQPYQYRNLTYVLSDFSVRAVNLTTLEFNNIRLANPLGAENLVRVNNLDFSIFDGDTKSLIYYGNVRNDNDFFRFNQEYNGRELTIDLKGSDNSNLVLKLVNNVDLSELEIINIVIDFRIRYSRKVNDISRPKRLVRELDPTGFLDQPKVVDKVNIKSNYKV